MTPLEDFVCKVLANVRHLILETIGDDRDVPSTDLDCCGYLIAHLEWIASGEIPCVELADRLDNLEAYFASPHAQQAVLAALVFRRAFQSPELTFDSKLFYPTKWLNHLSPLVMQGLCLILSQTIQN